MNPLTIKNEIVFSLVELKKWEELKISWNMIITVVAWKIKEKFKWTIKTFESSVYHSWNIKAEKNTLLTVFNIKNIDIILNKIDVDSEFWKFCRINWKQLREIYDVEWFEKIDLYRSNQIKHEYFWEKYKFNLWFCGKSLNEWNYNFHNQHDFIEVHTNIAWDWFMQKSDSLKWENLIETVWLMPWTSHRRFDLEWVKEKNRNPKYPFHRWLGWNTWNIWLVIEKY